MEKKNYAHTWRSENHWKQDLHAYLGHNQQALQSIIKSHPYSYFYIILSF